MKQRQTVRLYVRLSVLAIVDTFSEENLNGYKVK